MSKYWMVFALFGAIGCSGTPTEDSGSSQDTVSAADSGKDKALPNVAGKGNGCGDVTPPSTDGCTKELEAISLAIAGTKDPQTIAALIAKYDAVKMSCVPGQVPPKDPCAQELAAAQATLDAAIKSGDPAQIIAAKEKYAIISSSCAPAVPDKDVCTKELEAISLAIAGTKDPQTIAALIAKFDAVKMSCVPGQVPPKDPCPEELAAAQAMLDAAIKSGDTAQIVAAKQKYTIIWNSCAPATVPDKPPVSKDPGTPPAKDPGTPPAKDPGTPPPASDEPPTK